jgi:hypothetical protein
MHGIVRVWAKKKTSNNLAAFELKNKNYLIFQESSAVDLSSSVIRRESARNLVTIENAKTKLEFGDGEIAETIEQLLQV